MGENGAGKSTLVKILAGVHLPDAGVLRVDGRETVLAGPAAARAAGVAVIYQEPVQFPDLTVAENIFVGRQPLRSLRRIDRRIGCGIDHDLRTLGGDARRHLLRILEIGFGAAQRQHLPEWRQRRLQRTADLSVLAQNQQFHA